MEWEGRMKKELLREKKWCSTVGPDLPSILLWAAVYLCCSCTGSAAEQNDLWQCFQAEARLRVHLFHTPCGTGMPQPSPGWNSSTDLDLRCFLHHNSFIFFLPGSQLPGNGQKFCVCMWVMIWLLKQNQPKECSLVPFFPQTFFGICCVLLFPAV